MGIKTFSENLDIIQQLSDRPLELDGLGAEELKALFDKAGNLLKDYINTELVPAINGFAGKEHSHQNKALLDTVTPDAVHAHSNKALLDTLSEGSFHTHERLELLESYTKTNEEISGAVDKMHSHDNKNVLDGITADSILTAENRTLINNLSSPAGFAALVAPAIWTPLWKNTNPVSRFRSTTLSIENVKPCNLFLLQGGDDKVRGCRFTESFSMLIFCPIGKSVSTRLEHSYNSGGYSYYSDREVIINTANGTVYFGDGNDSEAGYDKKSRAAHNGYAVPYYLWGTRISEAFPSA